MTKFKVSIHCGQVNTFVVEEFEDKATALSYWGDRVEGLRDGLLLSIGDVLINPKQITFVVVEELIEKTEEPAAGATIEV